MNKFKVSSTSQYTGSTAAAVANVFLSLAQSQAAANSARASANSANIALAQIATISNTANSASANTISLKGGLNSANANISLLFAINNSQNISISLANTLAQSAYVLANSAYELAQYTANNVISNATDNTARILAQSAYDTANLASIPAGVDSSVQYKSGNTSIAGSNNFTYTDATQTLGLGNLRLTGTTGTIGFVSGTSQGITIQGSNQTAGGSYPVGGDVTIRGGTAGGSSTIGRGGSILIQSGNSGEAGGGNFLGSSVTIKSGPYVPYGTTTQSSIILDSGQDNYQGGEGAPPASAYVRASGITMRTGYGSSTTLLPGDFNVFLGEHSNYGGECGTFNVYSGSELTPILTIGSINNIGSFSPKIGFFGVTPVVRPVPIASNTSGILTALVSSLNNLGLINSSSLIPTSSSIDISEIVGLQEIQDSQNTDILNATTTGQSAFDRANSATNLAQAAFTSSNTVNNKAQNAYDAANSGVIFTRSVWNSSNNVGLLAQSAFDKAGLDVTSITSTAGTYGSATAVPVTTITDKGRVTSIVATSISPVTIGTTSISPGATSLNLQGLNYVELTANPTTNLQVATKQYVDSIGAGTNYHAPAAVATTINLSATYNNGPYSNGVGSNLTSTSTGALVVDSYTTLVNDRILVKDQTSSAQNGIYVVSANGFPAANWILTRTSDYDSNTTGEIMTGDTIFITGGSLNGNTSWTQTTGLPIIVGSTGLTFIQTSRITSYTAASPLTLTGTQFGLANTGTAGTYGNTTHIPTLTTDAYGRISSVTTPAISIPISQVVGLQGQQDTQNNNISLLQGGLNTANANIALLIAVNLSQNTLITAANTLASNANTLATSAYALGVSASANTILLQGGLNTANANIASLIAVNASQNTLITAANTLATNANILATSAHSIATNANTVSISASANTILLQGGLNTANANIASLIAVNLSQNTLITAANTLASNANTLATSAYSIATNANTVSISASANTIALQGGLNTANANIASLISVNATQNTNITGATTLAQAAFDKANTDVTSISTTAGTYGSATAVPVTTITDNGRVTGIVATSISPVTIGTTSISPGATSLTLDGLTSINVSSAPVVSTQVANKAYVDSVAAGSRPKTPAKVATTATLSATYNNGASGVGANLVSISTGPLAIDGYTTLVNDRILVKDQALSNQNGLYSVTANGVGPANWILTRSTDYDQPSEVLLNDTIFILNGSINGNTTYVQSANVSAIGTSNVNFILSSKIVAYTAAPSQLLLTGTQFGLATTGTAGTYGNTAYHPVITTDAYGRVTAVTNTAISISISQVLGLQGQQDTQNNSITVLQGGLNTANANIASLIAVNATQNTLITTANTLASNANTLATSAYSIATNANTVSISASANTIALQGGLNTANANIASLIAVNLSQNTLITTANTNAASAVTISSAASANTIALRGAMNTANANIASLITVNLTQNTNITAASSLAQNAFNRANTDVTSISTSAGTYGSSTAVPVAVIEANGRISAISTNSIQIDIGQVNSLQSALNNLNELISDINNNKLIGSYIVSLINDYLGSTTWQGGGGSGGGTGGETFIADVFVSDVFV